MCNLGSMGRARRPSQLIDWAGASEAVPWAGAPVEVDLDRFFGVDAAFGTPSRMRCVGRSSGLSLQSPPACVASPSTIYSCSTHASTSTAPCLCCSISTPIPHAPSIRRSSGPSIKLLPPPIQPGPFRLTYSDSISAGDPRFHRQFAGRHSRGNTSCLLSGAAWHITRSGLRYGRGQRICHAQHP